MIRSYRCTLPPKSSNRVITKHESTMERCNIIPDIPSHLLDVYDSFDGDWRARKVLRKLWTRFCKVYQSEFGGLLWSVLRQ